MDTRLSVYNLLVHYGPTGADNFIDLVQENALEVFIDSPEIHIRKKEYFVEELELIQGKETYFLKGRFTKQFDFLSERQIEDEKKVDRELIIQSLPHAYFLLDLVNHRLIWAQPKGITAPPTAGNFCTFFKRKIHQYLDAIAREDAKSHWENVRSEEKSGNKYQFVNDYLKKMGVRLSDIEVQALPLINKDEIRSLIMNEDMVVKLMRLRVYRPNASDREIKNAKGNFDELARFFNEKVNTNPEVIIKPSKEAGTKKKTEVVDITEKMADMENVELKVELQSKSSKKKTIISTSATEGEADVKYRRELPKAPSFLDLEDVEMVKNEIPEYQISVEERNDSELIVLEWVERVRTVFPKFPFKAK